MQKIFFAFSLICTCSFTAFAEAQTASSQPQLPLKQDKSIPLEQIKPHEPLRPLAPPGGDKEEREKQNFKLPLPEQKQPKSGQAGRTIMRLRSVNRIIPPPLKVKVLLAADGIRQGKNYKPAEGVFPPDANGSVGDDHYVQWVNQAIAVFDKKTGQMVKNPLGKNEPFSGNLIWTGFGGACEKDNDGDPIVLYDKNARRWLMSQFAIRDDGQHKFAQCIAISDGPDPIKSSYFRYEYGFEHLNDYPKFGIWGDAYYATFNMFSSMEGGFTGAKVCAFERAKMLVGDPSAKWDCIDPLDEEQKPVAGLLPADLDGSRLPAPGSPEYIVGFGSNELRLWKLNTDWSKPKPLSWASQAPTLLTVDNFSPACGDEDCILQKGTATTLGPLADRLMYRLAYRNFGDHESLVLTHTVTAGRTTGLRWYELRRNLVTQGSLPPAEFTVLQQQTFAEDHLFGWLGSVAMDRAGNIVLVYNASSDSSHPSLHFTGRTPTDPLGVMATQGVLVEGKRSVDADRWGDYASVSLDPKDDCTFWVTGQYLSGDNPPEDTIAVADNSNQRPGRNGTSTRPEPVRPAMGLKAEKVVSGYSWDTTIASLKFDTCVAE